MNLKQKQFIDSYIGIPLVFINVVFARFFGFLLRRNHSLNKPPGEICIIKLLGFGSIIMASDAIFSIKKKYPDAVLSVICSKGIEKGVSSLKLFDKVYVIDDASFFTTISSSLSVIFKLQRVSVLWTLDLEVYSKLTSILSLWTMANNRFGFFFNQVAFRYNLNTHNIYFNTVVQVEENYKRMIAATNVETVYPFFIPGFETKNTSGKQSYIAINNTCSELSPERKLTETQLSEICHWILANTPYGILLLGAPVDFANNDLFINQHFKSTDNIRNIAGVYSFEEYYRYLYTHCKLMITIDSAPLHIANKLSIPTISIWGPTTPESRIDTNVNTDYIYLHVSCSPCAHFVDKLPCNGDNFCIKNITLQQITSLIEKQIK